MITLELDDLGGCTIYSQDHQNSQSVSGWEKWLCCVFSGGICDVCVGRNLRTGNKSKERVNSDHSPIPLLKR